MNISTSNIRYRLKEKIQLHLKEQSPTGKQRTSDEQGVPSAPQAPSVGDQNTSAAATQQAQDYTQERDDAKNQPWYDKVMNNPIVARWALEEWRLQERHGRRWQLPRQQEH